MLPHLQFLSIILYLNPLEDLPFFILSLLLNPAEQDWLQNLDSPYKSTNSLLQNKHIFFCLHLCKLMLMLGISSPHSKHFVLLYEEFGLFLHHLTWFENTLPSIFSNSLSQYWHFLFFLAFILRLKHYNIFIWTFRNWTDYILVEYSSSALDAFELQIRCSTEWANTPKWWRLLCLC